MNKKLLMVLAAGALVLTGCAVNEANKEKDDKNKSEQNNASKEDQKHLMEMNCSLFRKKIIQMLSMNIQIKLTR